MEFLELESRGLCVIKNFFDITKLKDVGAEIEFSMFAESEPDFSFFNSLIVPKVKTVGTGIKGDIVSYTFQENGDGKLGQDSELKGLVCIIPMDYGSFYYSECSHVYGYLGEGNVDKERFSKLSHVSVSPGDMIIHKTHTIYKQNERPKCKSIKIIIV